MDTIIKIGGASINQTPIHWEHNVGNIIAAIEEARRMNIEILCLPELAVTGYGCEDLFLSAWLPEKASAMLKKVLPACHDIIAVVGLPIRENDKLYNCACVIRDRKIIGIYVKKFLANEGVHYEPRWFSPRLSDDTFEISLLGEKIPFGDFQFEYNGIKIGFEICEDAWAGSDRPACRLLETGVNLIINPSASHFSMGKALQRYDLVNKSSSEFKCTYLYVNLLGNEAGRMIYDGETLIAQEGRMIRSNKLLSFRDINIVSADINFSKPALTGISGNPNNYDTNEEFTSAASLGLFDYLRKSRNKGFVISLSGGADSSCCAVLVSEMIRRGTSELGIAGFLEKLGRPDILESVKDLNPEASVKKIIAQILSCAYQGSDNSSEETLTSARILAESIGAGFYSWKITHEAESYRGKIEKALNRPLTWSDDDIALQNIQARARSPVIWLLANLNRSILITTSNRSEGDVGYATMDGDTSGSLAPIAAVDKYFLRQWLRWAEKELNYPALAHVNRLIPTAELRPPGESQTDESDLMPYDIMVRIERLGIRERKSPKEVYELLKNIPDYKDGEIREYIIKFFSLWAANQWKRERTAPAFHLDDFNIDPRTWCRFPILSGSFRDELKELDTL